VAILITADERVLLVRRKNAHGAGTWAPPGGHLEFGESLAECAAREAHEETGVDVRDVRFLAITNDVFETEGLHYITVWMQGTAGGAEPSIKAADEVAELGWFAWDALPQPLFLPLQNLLAGRRYPASADPRV
jgi:8-oxo-dGTP diphosphatase